MSRFKYKDPNTGQWVYIAKKEEVDLKVDKVTGKGLSTNDYTNDEKNKLSGIAAGATKVEDSATNGNIKVNGTEIKVYDDTEVMSELSNLTTELTEHKEDYANSNPNQIKNKHRILFAGIGELVDYPHYFPMAEELYRNGYLLECCTHSALVANVEVYKGQFDVLILMNTRLSFDSPITPIELKNAVSTLMNSGVFVIWGHDMTTLAFDKYSGTGSATSSISVSDIFNNLIRGQKVITAGVLSHNSNYPFSSEIVKPDIEVTGNYINNYSSTDSTVIFPVVVSDGTNTANITAYKPGKFFVYGFAPGVAGNHKKSGLYKYVDYATLIPSVLNDEQKVRLSLDSKYGKKVAAIGVDGDVTIETNVVEELLDAVNTRKHHVEYGIVSSYIDDELAQFYRGLPSRFANTYLCSHTGYHYKAPITVTDEVHTIKNQMVILKKPFNAILTSVKSVDGLITFTKNSSNINRGNPTETQYCVDVAPYNTSIVGGRIKFNLAKEGTQVKISYTYNNEYEEILGSIKTLKDKGLLTDNGVYLTMGTNSLSGLTVKASEIDDIAFSEYISFPSGYRLKSLLRDYNEKMPYLHGVSMVYEDELGNYNNMDDISILKQYSKDTFKTTIFPSAINRCIQKELPFVSYIHDISMAFDYSSSVWNGTGFNADWKKATYEDTVAYLKEFYTWMFAQIDLQNTIWITRNEYARRYKDMNKYVSYDYKKVGESYYLYIENKGKKAIKGLTFHINLDTAPTTIKKMLDEDISFTYSNNIVTIWLDMASGEKATILIE